MPPVIHYTSTKPPSGKDKQIFGLHVAIADLLKAYFRHARTEKFTFLIGAEDEWKEIQKLASQAGVDASRLVALDRRFPEQNFAHFTTVFRAEPDTRGLLWQRQIHGDYNFCGLAHAISGVEAGEVLQEYCLAPSQEADAIICPSQAVKSAIRAFWDHYGDYLNKRFGASYKCPVQLPVLPLGINVEKFAAKVTQDKRDGQRKKLGIAENDIVILWVGRCSAAIKAHPLAMFQAVERAAEKTGVRVHFIMVGYFVPEEAEGQFKKLASDICRKATVKFIAANDPRFPDGLWAAGDIFLSLIDNIQESFGLTPIEAMAAGLPRVVSDWDGYRDSVTDGEDGFLIRTVQPPAGNGFDLTMQVLSGREVYGGFLAKAALTVAIDAEQAADRLAQLIMDKNLRASMAQKARARAHATYDWKHIIPAYEDLWRDLEERRKKHRSKKESYASALPQLPDPYEMYGTYPAARLDETMYLSLAASVEQIQILWRHEINMYANDVLIAPQEITALLGFVDEQKQAAIGDVFARFANLNRPRLWRTIAWLLKLSILKKN